MDITQLNSNSDASRESAAEETTVKSTKAMVPSSCVTTKPPGFFQMAKDAMPFPKDPYERKQYIIQDILLPEILNFFHSTCSHALDYFFGFGGYYPGQSTVQKVGGMIVRSAKNSAYDYSRRYRGTPVQPRGPVMPAQDETEMVSWDNIVIRPDPSTEVNDMRKAHAKAEKIIWELQMICAKYGRARLSDLYEKTGKSFRYTANNKGWYDLSNAYATGISGGYLLVLPPPVDFVEEDK